jgi:16S rRNA (cytosine967-C5)-methyltransferase
MSRAGSQSRTLAALLGRLRPHWHTDAALPGRIDALLGGDRRLGSRDRRLYRELIYTTLRYLPWIEPELGTLDGPPAKAGRALERIAWLSAETPATHDFRTEFASALPPCPADSASKAGVLGLNPDLLEPDWFKAECPDAARPALRDSLLSRAPLWLRLQTDESREVYGEFGRMGWDFRVSDLLPDAVRIAGDADLTRTRSHREGRIEIQDLGSQLVLESVGVEPGGRWLDACAGAGGKTLQLARLLGAAGRVEARDVRRSALEELERRAQRAGLSGRIGRAGPGFDGVLVDAPCTGTGTWRRSPHLKWVTRAQRVVEAASIQLSLLGEQAGEVRPGGRLVYATCSLCRSENEAVVEAFLSAHPAFEPSPLDPGRGGDSRGAGAYFWPQVHDGDGFFVASLRRVR